MRPELRLNYQETFDKVVQHLRQQHAKAVQGATGGCMYRAPNGMKCAIGSVIPDDLYSDQMEGHRITQLSKTQYPWMDVDLAIFCRRHLPLLRDLQLTHDTHQVEQWEQDFPWIAAKYDLQLDGQRLNLDPQDNPFLSAFEKVELKNRRPDPPSSPTYPDANPGEL